MRIALVALSCTRGGMLHYSSQLANALGDRAEVGFFTPFQPELAGRFGPRIALRDIPALNKPNDRLGTALRQANPARYGAIAAAIRKFRPDVVHLVTNHPCNGVVAWALNRLPVCFTHHDPEGHPGERSPLRDTLTKLMVARANRLVVHADALRDSLLRQGVPSDRIAVIPHGAFDFLQAHASSVPEEPLILCFGRFAPYKGIEVLCRAERRLVEMLPEDYQLVIAGEGDPSGFAAEIGPSGRVAVINRFLPDGEVAALFERARIVVLPYTQASQSGVLAIAFAFGKPAVVTDVGGLPEAVDRGKAGLLVPPDDPCALADAIGRLWRDPALRASLGEAGRRKAGGELRWSAVAGRHLVVYGEAMRREIRHGGPEAA